ncbi:hypothetical protein NC651_021340 [Populus alba x Populus x berolinensis]|nr:hypothetical protein NC651_021340 [Populus alba x Populus x berolinensis]
MLQNDSEVASGCLRNFSQPFSVLLQNDSEVASGCLRNFSQVVLPPILGVETQLLSPWVHVNFSLYTNKPKHWFLLCTPPDCVILLNLLLLYNTSHLTRLHIKLCSVAKRFRSGIWVPQKLLSGYSSSNIGSRNPVIESLGSCKLLFIHKQTKTLVPVMYSS